MDEKRNQTELFDQPDINVKRTDFDLSFPNKMTLNFNKMVPILCQKTMPGDSWHIKSDVFSRWLAMQAPVFSEYALKFNSAYVANNLIYGGWQQFIGAGDDQAAQYLLDEQANAIGGGNHGLDHELPHFTSWDIATYPLHKVVMTEGYTADSPTPDYGYQLHISPMFKPLFRLFAAPVICTDYVTGAHSGSGSWTSYPDSSCLNFSTMKQAVIWVLGSTADNAFWDEMVAKGYVFEATNMESPDVDLYGFTVDSGGIKTHDWAFYCHGANLNTIEKNWTGTLPALIELPKDTFFLTESDWQDLQYESTAAGARATTNFAMSASLFTAQNNTRFFYRCRTVYATNLGAQVYGSQATAVTPYGCIYHMLPSETYKNNNNKFKVGYLTLFHRTIGQHVVKRLLGAGTLTDYLGKCYSQSLLRQPFDVANKLLGNVVQYEHGYNNFQHPTTEAFNPQGTYNESSDKYEIGVVNQVEISILPYLAYHKIWNDYIRDPRYELRYLYADQYRSPFMRPLEGVSSTSALGRYREGNIIDTQSNQYNPRLGWIFYNDVTYNNLDDGVFENDMSKYMTPEKPFYWCSFTELISLRDRRVVHDYFTMVTPSPQMGEQTSIPTLGNVNDLRLATRFQKFLERSNFVGSDFVKQILAHFGVKPDNCNHCATRWLGGKIMKPTLSPVTITSTDSDTQVTGEQTGQMYCSGSLNKIDLQTNEHGYIFQIVTIQNDFFTTDGYDKDPITYMDYPLPEMGDLGPQQICLGRVVGTDGTYNLDQKNFGTDNNPFAVFGYVPRYADWKCNLAQIHGDFRKSLSYWVSKRQLNPDLLNGSFGYGKRGNIPQVGKAFLYENPDYNAFTYTGEEYDHALLDINHIITCSRELPKLPNPQVL